MRIVRTTLLAASVLLVTGCVVDSEMSESQSDALDSQPSGPAKLQLGAFGFTSLDVGQGDAAVVLAPGGCVALLDAGPTGSGKTIKSYLHSLNVTRIDFAVLSHYHEDHLGGLDEVERGDDAIPIGTVYDHGGSYSSGAYTQYDRQFRGRRTAVAAGDTMSLCAQVDFKVVASDANGRPTSDENVRSVVVKVSYGALDVLVGGDLGWGGPDIESTVAAEIGPIEVYKVHHHGSAGASSARFLDATKPTVSVISVAQNNSYGHPTPSTLSRLNAAGSAIWQTAGSTTAPRGNVEISASDGSSFTVTKNDSSASYASKPAPVASP